VKIKYVRYTKDYTKSFIRLEEVNLRDGIIGVFNKKKSKKALELILMNKLLGQKVKAFGSKGQGYWGTSSRVHTYKINDIVIEDPDDNTYDNFRIYLEKYNSTKDGYIYTDNTFEANINELIKDLGDLDYTEQGMQGKNYVSMTISYRDR